MKKLLKYIGLCFIILFGMGIVFGNILKIISDKNKSAVEPLEIMLAKINKHLPCKGFNGFDYFTMDRVVLEDNNVIWDATIDTTYFYPTRECTLPESVNGCILVSGDRNHVIDLDTLLSNELMKESHKLYLFYYHLFVRSKETNKLYEEIMKRQCSQIYRYHSPFSDKQCEFIMTYDEQKEVEQYCKNNPPKALQEFMSEYLKRQNRLLELASLNADVMMHIEEDGSNIVFYCIFDKSCSVDGYNPISDMRKNQREMKEFLTEDIHTLPLFFGLEEICKKASKRFVFRYTDWNRSDSIEFKI